jgi:hypothetical protein|tara:strand:- start:1632 stop:2219 length:588 start_codon:yes stop_codon:yes gene_type:complete
MAYNREGYAPWSLTRKAGVQSATVDGTIEVPQYIQPVLDTGFVDEKGDWKGTKSSDEEFHAFDKHVGIPNGGEVLTPQSTSDNFWVLDMTGFKDLQLAIRTTNGGNYSITACMGPDSNSYANLRPVNPAATLRGNRGFDQGFSDVLVDSADSLTADVWNIFMISNNLHGQKLLQFKIVNNSGGEAIIETAFMRLV